MKTALGILVVAALFLLGGCIRQASGGDDVASAAFEVTKTDAEWKTALTAEEYYVLREQGTERAFTGDLWDHHDEGVYTCAGCGQEVFPSSTKFESGTGWPSYHTPIKAGVATTTDRSWGMSRTEVHCSRCGGHLGHVFTDGPAPSGLRYCINSVSLNFVPASSAKPAATP